MLNILKKSCFIFILYKRYCKIRMEQNQRDLQKMQAKKGTHE